MRKVIKVLAPLIVLGVPAALAADATAPAAASPTAASVSELAKKLGVQFYVSGNTFDYKAVEHLLGEYYVQHSPNIESGQAGLKKALDSFKANYVGRSVPKVDIRIVIAEGNYVAMLSHIIPDSGGPGIAVGDLWRTEDGKLAEHWDVTERLEPRPPGQGMFDQPGAQKLGPGLIN